jgi:hypothetical protein
VNLIPHDQSNPPPEECASTRENLEAFALDALDSLDRGMVEHHLRWCDPCRREADRFEHVTLALPLATAPSVSPAPSTWAAIRARLDEPESSLEVQAKPPTRVTTASASRPRWTHFAYPAVIAPLVIALVIMGAWVNSLHRQIDDTSAELANQALLNSTLSDGGQVQLYSVERTCPNCEGIGQFGVSESNSMGMLVGWDFDPTVDHQVWGIDEDGDLQKFCHLRVKADGAVMQMFVFPESPSTFTDLYIMNEFGELTYVSHMSLDDPATVPGTTEPAIN